MPAAGLSFLIILAVMVAFYLIFIWPAQREQRRLRKEIRELEVGDEVLTVGGFIARVKDIRTPEDGPLELVLELASGVEVRALTSAIARRLKRAEETTEAALREAAREV
jgi:preprotein translocase subunit YajC